MQAKIIGAGRVLLPDPERAKAKGFRYGLAIEETLDVDLSHLGPASAIGEVGRLCVERRWQGTSALAELCVAMCTDSLSQGVEHWISAANMECDAVAEARLVVRVLEQRGLVRHDVAAAVRTRGAPAGAPRFMFFTEEERRRVIEGERVEQLRLPRAVAADARLGARYFAEPVWDPHFGMYAMPLVASVRDVLRAAERLLRVARRGRSGPS